MTRRLIALLVVAAVGWPACERVATAHTPTAVTCPEDGKTACVDRWRPTALRAGWPSSSWPWLRCIIWRESGGQPRAWNRRDPAGGSLGLTQINLVHVPWLIRRGVITRRADLLTPAGNLRAARAVHRLQGRTAWASTRSC